MHRKYKLHNFHRYKITFSSTIGALSIVSVLIVVGRHSFQSRQKFLQCQHFEYFVHSQLVVWTTFQKMMHAFSRVSISVAAFPAVNECMFVILLSHNCTPCLFQNHGYPFHMADRGGLCSPTQVSLLCDRKYCG